MNTAKGAIGIIPRPSDMSFESVLAQTNSFMRVKNARGVIVAPESGGNVVRHHEHLIEIPHHMLVL